MPTTLYSKNNHSSVGHGGKSYEVIDGAVSVPDDAVPILIESHDFSLEPFHVKHPIELEKEENGDEAPPLESMNKTQLLAFARDNCELDLPTATPKAEILTAINEWFESAKNDLEAGKSAE